jgi:hypothetical protein
MERRQAIFTLLGAGSLLTAGCDSEEKPDATATLLNNENVHKAMKAVVDAVETLESDVDEFSSTNWREVVPNVENATVDLRDAVDTLRKELGYTN